jgi:hypothetical protein
MFVDKSRHASVLGKSRLSTTVEKEYILADKSSLSSVFDQNRLLFGWRRKCLKSRTE